MIMVFHIVIRTASFGGVKVPVGVKHTYERVPFAEAYPQFTEWVQSNGAQNKDWYLAPLYGKVVEAW